VRSFAAKSRLPESSLVPWDLLAGAPSLDQIRKHDALMVGGSGDYYVSKRNLPDFDRLLGVLAEAVAQGPPIFASCFGFQCLVEALGGSIIHDADNTEVGTFELALTADGERDDLLGTLPKQFLAQLGRKDRAEKLPEGIPNLASSPRAPFQAFRVPGAPVWATQFHPELNGAENRQRFLRYLNGYAVKMERQQRAAVLRSFRESPETAELIRRFLELIGS
jgi:GMP synthase (glutamine-hydrolysing)